MSAINIYSPLNNIVLDAMKGKKIKELKKSEFSDKIKEAIIQGLIVLGQKQESGQITVMTDCLIHELKNTLTQYTPDEVVLAIDYGTKGKLCEFSTLQYPVMSVTNCLKFIKLYNENIRREAVHKQKEEEEKKEKVISDIERDAKIKAFEQEIGKALLMTSEQLKELPTGLKAAYFRHLESKEQSTITIEQKKEIYAICEKLVSIPKKSDLGLFADMVNENKKRDAQIKELCQSMAFERLAE